MHSYYPSSGDEEKMENPEDRHDAGMYYRETTTFPQPTLAEQYEIGQRVTAPSRWARVVPFLKGTAFVLMVLGIALAISLSYNTAINEQKHFMMNFEVQARVVKLEKALGDYEKRLYLIEDLSYKKDLPSDNTTP